MAGHKDFQQALHVAFGEGLVVVFQHRLERLLVFPFRVLGGHAFDFVEGKQLLEITRLFAPQGAIVVEHGDARFGFYKALAVRRGNRLDKLNDAFFRRAFVPGGQGVGSQGEQRQGEQKRRQGCSRCRGTRLRKGPQGLQDFGAASLPIAASCLGSDYGF